MSYNLPDGLSENDLIEELDQEEEPEGPDYDEVREMELIDQLNSLNDDIRLKNLEDIPRTEDQNSLAHHVSLSEFTAGRTVKYCARCKHDQILHFGGRCAAERGSCGCRKFEVEE